MKKITAVLLAILIGNCMISSLAKESVTMIDNYSDTWTATDHMGRRLASFEEAGPVKEGLHEVGIFYWNWHRHSEKAVVAQDVIKAYPEAKDDFYHKAWGNGVDAFWGESVYGFYRTEDYWHNRRAGELLAAAGVDAIFFDVTFKLLSVELWNQNYAHTTIKRNMDTDPEAESVKVWQKTQHRITRLQKLRHEIFSTEGLGVEVKTREHYAFGFTRGAARIENHGWLMRVRMYVQNT